MRCLEVSTAKGKFEIELLHDQAPQTCHYFETLAKLGQLDQSSVFRIVNEDNSFKKPPSINVLQVGTEKGYAEAKTIITHESTSVTGLSHRKWSVSAARFQPGTLYKSFFICMRDEPELDYGGRRHADGHGFAAFGRVSSGYRAVEAIFDCAEEDEILSTPIPVPIISSHH